MGMFKPVNIIWKDSNGVIRIEEKWIDKRTEDAMRTSAGLPIRLQDK